jgi:YHS domain-containing protein
VGASTGTKVSQYDPICGKPIADDAEDLPTAEYKKRKYLFCSDTCRRVFQRQALKFRMSELARAGALLSPGRVRWGLG